MIHRSIIRVLFFCFSLALFSCSQSDCKADESTVTELAGLSSGSVYWLDGANGSDENDGSFASPFASLKAAQSVLAAGDTLYIRGGTYAVSADQIMDDTGSSYTLVYKFATSGTAASPICYVGYPGERPVFDFSAIDSSVVSEKRITAFYISGSYLYFKNFEVRGVQVVINDGSNTQSECFRVYGGSHNTFENLSMHDGAGIGWYLVSGSYNLVLNCDAYNNFDSVNGGGNVDGFGAHPNRTTMPGNMFVGCRAWYNSDDGFDLITAYSAVEIRSSWAWKNGMAEVDGTLTRFADGNGLKAGGYGRRDVSGTFTSTDLVPRHTVSNSIAWANPSAGVYANHHLCGTDESGDDQALWGGLIFEYCTSAQNRYNYYTPSRYELTAVTGSDPINQDAINYTLTNNLGYGATSLETGYFDVDDETSCAQNTFSGNTFQDSTNALTASDFESTDGSLLLADRAFDGSLPDTAFLRIASDSYWYDKDVGFSYSRYEEQVAAAKEESGCFAQ